MKETNIDAAGYELLNIATLVASSDGVLRDISSEEWSGSEN